MDVLARQYRTVQLSGLTNMFDRNGVMYYANEANFYDLVVFIADSSPKSYFEFLESYDWDKIEPLDDKLEELKELRESAY